MSESPSSDNFDSQVSMVPSSVTEPNSCLLRVGEGKKFIEFEKADAEIFLHWWNTTQWATTHSNTIKWESTAKTSKVWHIFKPVAEIRTGNPKVMCSQCEATLEHPGIKNSGTNSLKSHLKSNACKKKSRSRATVQSRIVDYVNANVSLLILFTRLDSYHISCMHSCIDR